MNIPSHAGRDKIFDGLSQRAACPDETRRDRQRGHRQLIHVTAGAEARPFCGRNCRHASRHHFRPAVFSYGSGVVRTDDRGEVELREKGLVLAPGSDIRQRIGTAQEYGCERWRFGPEGPQGVDREANAPLRDLERRNPDSESVLDGEVEHLEAVVTSCQASFGLVGRIRAREQEYALESERSERVAGKRHMAAMNRVERAAEHTHGRQG
jgi:hypothetical protein